MLLLYGKKRRFLRLARKHTSIFTIQQYFMALFGIEPHKAIPMRDASPTSEDNCVIILFINIGVR